MPEPFAALARQVAGEIADVADCSWERDSSAVWRLTGAGGGCWYLKRHSSGPFHTREVAALRGWARALGPGRVPGLAAADPGLLVMVVTAVPGQPVAGTRLGVLAEREVHRQAGLLLGRLHAVRQAADGEGVAGRLAGRTGEYLDQVGALLTPAQRALVPGCAARVAALAPRLPAVAGHGDFQPRNWLWDPCAGRLGVIDWERAEPAPAVRDLARLEDGPWDGRPDLREAFFTGYGRTLTGEEQEMLAAYAVLDALSGLRWGLANGDADVAERARRTFERAAPL